MFIQILTFLHQLLLDLLQRFALGFRHVEKYIWDGGQQHYAVEKEHVFFCEQVDQRLIGYCRGEGEDAKDDIIDTSGHAFDVRWEDLAQYRVRHREDAHEDGHFEEY